MIVFTIVDICYFSFKCKTVSHSLSENNKRLKKYSQFFFWQSSEFQYHMCFVCSLVAEFHELNFIVFILI